jgi:hypothetical protein
MCALSAAASSDMLTDVEIARVHIGRPAKYENSEGKFFVISITDHR